MNSIELHKLKLHLLKEDATHDAIDRSELNMLKKLYQRTPTKKIEDKIKALEDKLKNSDKATNESEDHEVAMAISSLKEIISNASQLMSKLGEDEKNIPGWIQDHITNSENYIAQANKGYHELDNSGEEFDDEI